MPRFATPGRKRYFFGVLAGIVVGFFCFIPAVEFTVAHQLAQRSVSVNRVDFLPLSMSLKLYGVEYLGNRRQLYLDEVQFRPSSRFWERGSFRRFEADILGGFLRIQMAGSSKESAVGNPRSSALSLLSEIKLNWDVIQVALQWNEVDCQGDLAAGSNGREDPPVSLRVQCAGGPMSPVSLEGKLSLAEVPSVLALTHVVIRDAYEHRLNVQLAEFEPRTKLIRLERVEGQLLSIDFILPQLEMRFAGRRLSVYGHGGVLSVKKQPSRGLNHANSVNAEDLRGSKDDPLSFPLWNRFSQLEDALGTLLPVLETQWRALLIFWGEKQVGQVSELYSNGKYASVHLDRGDSTITVSHEFGTQLFENPIYLTGTLNLSDIGDIWGGHALVDGQLNAMARVYLNEGQTDLNFEVSRLRVMHPALSLTPMHLNDIYTSTEFSVHPEGLEIEGHVRMGALNPHFQCRVNPVSGDLNLRIDHDHSPCNDLNDALPTELRKKLALKLEGEMTPSLLLKIENGDFENLDFRVRKLLEPCRVSHMNIDWKEAGIALPRPIGGWALPRVGDGPEVLNGSFKKRIDSTYALETEIEVGPATHNYVKLEQLPRHVWATMYLSEEVYFFRNSAIDWGLLRRALRLDLTHGRYVYGGSTVTQQLVKNLLLDRRKTLARKVEELFLAHWVTERISKTRILELYLNVIEFGPQIFGINQAAEFYFQKSPMSLSVDESLFLAMLKPSPKLGRQYVADGQTPQYPFWHERAVQLRRRLQENGFMTVSEKKLSAPLTLKWTNGLYQPNDDPGAN